MDGSGSCLCAAQLEDINQYVTLSVDLNDRSHAISRKEVKLIKELIVFVRKHCPWDTCISSPPEKT